MKAQVQHEKIHEGRSYACDPYIVIVLEYAHEAEMMWHVLNCGQGETRYCAGNTRVNLRELHDFRFAVYEKLNSVYDLPSGISQRRSPFPSEPES